MTQRPWWSHWAPLRSCIDPRKLMTNEKLPEELSNVVWRVYNRHCDHFCGTKRDRIRGHKTTILVPQGLQNVIPELTITLAFGYCIWLQQCQWSHLEYMTKHGMYHWAKHSLQDVCVLHTLIVKVAFPLILKFVDNNGVTVAYWTHVYSPARKLLQLITKSFRWAPYSSSFMAWTNQVTQKNAGVELANAVID